MTAKWQNADGLGVKFASYVKDASNYVNKFRHLEKDGIVQQAVGFLDLTKIATGTTAYPADLNNDGTNDGFTEGDFNFPANSSIIRVFLVVTEAAAGGTSFTLGTYLKAGTAISANSLITATEGVLANIDTLGSRTFGAGALVSTSVETAGVGTAAAFPAFAGVGTWTAGKAIVVIDYVPPMPNVTSA